MIAMRLGSWYIATCTPISGFAHAVPVANSMCIGYGSGSVYTYRRNGAAQELVTPGDATEFTAAALSVAASLGSSTSERLLHASRVVSHKSDGWQSRGVVHADIKEPNAMLTTLAADGVVKLADFGTAIQLANGELASGAGSLYRLVAAVLKLIVL